MRRLIVPAILTALIAAGFTMTAAACGSGSSSHALDGTSWRLSGWPLDSLAPSQFTITAAFADGKISGSSGVNTYGGPYTAGPGDAFRVGQLSSTAMGGLGPDMRAESAYVALLAAARSYKLAGDELVLHDANGNQSLIFRRATL